LHALSAKCSQGQAILARHMLAASSAIPSMFTICMTVMQAAQMMPMACVKCGLLQLSSPQTCVRFLYNSHLLCCSILLWCVIIDGAAVLRPSVTSLPVLCRGIYMMKEGVQQPLVLHFLRVIDDLHGHQHHQHTSAHILHTSVLLFIFSAGVLHVRLLTAWPCTGI